MTTQTSIDFTAPQWLQGETEEAPPRNTMLNAVRALKALDGFIGPSQLHCVANAMRGEEKQFFFDKMVELAQTVSTMPKTYEQDGKGEEAIAYLHYFAGGQANWWITEKIWASRRRSQRPQKVWSRKVNIKPLGWRTYSATATNSATSPSLRSSPMAGSWTFTSTPKH